ncbi:MAG: hypothetical protein JNL12_01725 [Planctomycetes bacterium]|nr:hypothetical protein [Planctomycetota bacterium]
MRNALTRLARWSTIGLLTACSAVRPEDVPEVAPLIPADAEASAANRDRDFPGAAALLRGFDLAGERQLRDGDQLLFGITVHDPDRPIERHLLRLLVRQDDRELSTKFATMRDATGRVVLERPTRAVGLDLALFGADGAPLATSHLDSMDVFLGSSFVESVARSRAGESVRQLLVQSQLAEIANLLANDPILQRLLREVASIPWDVRLLWRQELTLRTDCNQATVPAGRGEGPLAAQFDQPFDLFLNDSLLVRLSVAVAEPHGPTAAVAGIVRLVAQQADRPERRLELELLATARGQRSEFAAHGAAAFLGFTDEGTGLAYSPDGRWLALPGSHGVVELRDLHRADPSVPCRLLGERAEVRALHFLDAGTLLVARGAVVECFDCTKATVGEERPATAAIRGSATGANAVLAIEPAGERSVFVGFAGAEVERWTFTDPATVRREAVRAATFEVMSVQRSDGKQQDLQVRRHPPLGWLLGSAAGDRCVVRWPENREVPSAADALWQRGDDGTWREQPLPPLPKEFSRQARWRTGEDDGLAWDEVAFGQMMARPRQGGGHGAVAGFVGITFRTTRTLGMCHDANRRFVHGFSPDGRFYAYCAPGHRVLAKVPEVQAEAASQAPREASNDAPRAPMR